MTKIFLNGQFLDEKDALVNVNERAVRFGDGIFETIPIYNSKPYLWRYHAQRLQTGLAALQIPLVDDLFNDALALIKENAVTQGLLRLSMSRGGGSLGYLPYPYPSDAPPTVIMQILPSPTPPTQPVALFLSSYEKTSPHALPTHCKLTQGVGSILARMEAVDKGCFEALQLAPGNMIAEASSCNIFWRKEGKLYTSSLSCGALAGVTRRRIMELSPYPVYDGKYPLEALHKADAVVLTNAALGIIPIGVLLPQNWLWKSEALARELNELRQTDIQSELLA